MARPEARGRACATPAALSRRELSLAADAQESQTVQRLPLWQIRSGKPAYVGPVGPNYSTSMQALISAGTGMMIQLANQTTWALTLVNYMPQSFQMWRPDDQVTITADEQTYILYNQRLRTILRAIYLG